MIQAKKGAGSVNVIMGVVVSVIMVVSVAIPIITSQNTSGLSAETVTIYGLLPLLLVVGAIVMAIVKYYF